MRLKKKRAFRAFRGSKKLRAFPRKRRGHRFTQLKHTAFCGTVRIFTFPIGRQDCRFPTKKLASAAGIGDAFGRSGPIRQVPANPVRSGRKQRQSGSLGVVVNPAFLMPTKNANFNFSVKIERLFLAHGNVLAFNLSQVVSAGISPQERT